MVDRERDFDSDFFGNFSTCELKQQSTRPLVASFYFYPRFGEQAFFTGRIPNTFLPRGAEAARGTIVPG